MAFFVPMRIQTKTSIDFQLPADFEAELTRTNVLLTEQGEQTVPLTLPGTPHNLQLIGYSNRLDNYYKPLTDLEVIVSDGLFQRTGNMGIHTASQKEGISCTLYLETGDFYSKISDATLNSLSWPVITHPTPLQNLNTKVLWLIDYLKDPANDHLFALDSVLTSQEFSWKVYKKNDAGDDVLTNVKELFILNDYDRYNGIIDQQRDYYQSPDPDEMAVTDVITHFAGEYLQTQIEDGVEIQLTRGYGITPFLRLKYILKFVFEAYGYTYNLQSTISQLPQFESICVLNNVADAIYAGTLYMRQLVPDVTIKEFVAKIETLLCGKFIFDSKSKSVVFVGYKQRIPINPDIDLTPYITSNPVFEQTSFENIILKYDGDNSAIPENNKDEKTTVITFNKEKSTAVVTSYFYWTYLNELVRRYNKPYFTLTRNLITIENIVHLNSSIVINGETQSGDTKATSKMFFGCLGKLSYALKQINLYAALVEGDPGYPGSYYNGAASVQYKTSFRMFHGSGTNDLDVIKTLYSEYVGFMKNSNIPITLEMNLPAPILESLDLSVPKIVQGQKLMIESIVQKLGRKDIQKVKLRTLRSYATHP